MSYQQALIASIYRLSLWLLFGCTISASGVCAHKAKPLTQDFKKALIRDLKIVCKEDDTLYKQCKEKAKNGDVQELANIVQAQYKSVRSSGMPVEQTMEKAFLHVITHVHRFPEVFQEKAQQPQNEPQVASNTNPSTQGLNSREISTNLANILSAWRSLSRADIMQSGLLTHHLLEMAAKNAPLLLQLDEEYVKMLGLDMLTLRRLASLKKWENLEEYDMPTLLQVAWLPKNKLPKKKKAPLDKSKIVEGFYTRQQRILNAFQGYNIDDPKEVVQCTKHLTAIFMGGFFSMAMRQICRGFKYLLSRKRVTPSATAQPKPLPQLVKLIVSKGTKNPTERTTINGANKKAINPPKPPTTPRAPADPQPKLPTSRAGSSFKGPKGLQIVLAAAVTGACVYAYNRYIAKKKKANPTDAGSASSQNNWLFFILCLLLGCLLVGGVFSRKKTPRE